MRPAVARDLRRVQVRTTAVTTLVLIAILVLAGYILVTLFRRELTHQVDSRLLLASDYVARVGATDERFPPIGTAFDLVQVVDDQGRITYNSPAHHRGTRLWTPSSGRTQPHTVQTADGGELRVNAVRFRDRWVIFASSLAPVDDDVRTLQKAMVVGLPPLTLMLSILVWVVVGRTVRPVAAARQREEQLIGDVSHELRSPLAGLRVLLETEPDQPDDIRHNRNEALTALSRLETISDQLLTLTRQERPPEHKPHQPVDIDEIVLQQARSLARRTHVPIDTQDVTPGQIIGRANDLTSLVDNLLTNATRHARSLVNVTLTEQDGTVTLSVGDDGPGIDAQDRERIFQRFTRLDEARSRDQGGAGLGLAIGRAVAESHGGTITVEDSDLGGARFKVRLPASTTPSRSPRQGR